MAVGRFVSQLTLIACVTAALAFTTVLTQAADGDRVAPPSVPGEITLPAGFKPFLVAHAVGTQSYMCLWTGSAVAWAPVGPQATLFNDDVEQTLTHFLSPNPFMNGTPDATWLHSRDTSSVWARKIAESSDPAFVAQDAIPWFLLRVVGSLEGPTGGDKLTPATFIHRVNTTRGKAPAIGCSLPTHINNRTFVPYTADYYFYAAEDSDR